MQATIHPPRKRRTVLWLFNEDYEFLDRIAKADGETKNASMHRLIRALRVNQVTSFRALENVLKALPTRTREPQP